MKIGKGAILGLIGGLLGIVGVFLPWVTISASAGGITLSVSASGMCLAGVGSISVGIPGAPTIPCSMIQSGEGQAYAYGVLAFSVLGLIFVLIPKKATAILALVFGLLVLVIAGIAIARVTQALAALAASVPGASVGAGYGLYLSIVGGILLLLGGVLAMGDIKKWAMAPAAPMPMTPPMPPAP